MSSSIEETFGEHRVFHITYGFTQIVLTHTPRRRKVEWRYSPSNIDLCTRLVVTFTSRFTLSCGLEKSSYS
jgi:hypothetical protein